MDPIVKEFMQRIMWSLFAALTWLMINAIAGLRFELAISVFFLFRLFKKLWKEHL